MDRLPSLADLPVRELLAAVADRTPTPGAGSAVAVACGLAASLVEMAARFTLARPELADRHARMREVQSRAVQLRALSLTLGERELDAYTPVLEAARLPPQDPERRARLRTARSRAAEPPLELARVGAELAGLGAEVAHTGNRNLAGDAIAGAVLAEAACRAAARLVELNLTGFGGDADRASDAQDRNRESLAQDPDREASAEDARWSSVAGLVRLSWQSRLKALEVNADTPRTEKRTIRGG